MQPNNVMHGGGLHLLCSHCNCSPIQIGYKLFNDHLNVENSTDSRGNLNPNPTVLEAITLIFGFRMPPPERLYQPNAKGVPFFDSRGSNPAICVNCESVLLKLYKVFLLFTELSNGRESFILKNSIISGRMYKEEDVIQLDLPSGIPPGRNPNTLHYYPQVTNTPLHPPHPLILTTASVLRPTLNTIRRELSADVIAEMYVPNCPRDVTITPVSDVGHHNPGYPAAQPRAPFLPPPPNLVPARPNQKPKASSSNNTNNPVEIITLDEEEEVQSPTVTPTSSQKPGQKRPITANHTPLQRRLATNMSSASSPTKSRTQEFSDGQPSPKSSRPAATIIAASPANMPHFQEPFPAGVSDASRVAILCKKKGLVSEVTTARARLKCDDCPLHFTNVVALLRHSQMEHGRPGPGRAFDRPHEGQATFPSPPTLKSHLNHINSSNSPLYTCKTPGCGKHYTEQRLLRRHATMTGHLEESDDSRANDKNNVHSTESDSDYWTTGIKVIHDPDQVMKKLEEAAVQEKLKSSTQPCNN